MEEIIRLIEAAFREVTGPDESEPTLAQAHAFASYLQEGERDEQYLSDWRRIPPSYFAQNLDALPHLGKQGLQYYLPALMELYLRESGSLSDLHPMERLFQSLEFHLQPATLRLSAPGLPEYLERTLNLTSAQVQSLIEPDPELVEYQRDRFSLLTQDQRTAIASFVQYVARHLEVAEQGWLEVEQTLQAWERAASAKHNWFDAFISLKTDN